MGWAHAARGGDAVRRARGPHPPPRGHDEAARETAADRRVPPPHPEGRGRPRRPDRDRAHLSGGGPEGAERRLGHPREGPRADPPGPPRRATAHNPRRPARVRGGRGRERVRVRPGPPPAPPEPPGPGLPRGEGGPPEEHLRRDADRRQRGRDARGDRGRGGREPGGRADGPYVPRGPGRVAEVALSDGAAGLAAQSLRLLSPVKPMMAELGDDLDEVLKEHGGTTALEFKFDGARIQIHRRGDEVRVFSRRLTDVTESVPEVVEFARTVPAESFLLEGEVVAVDSQGRPRPFQELMRRFRRVHEIEALRREIPLKLYLFDLLYLEGRSLISAPYRERWAALERLVPREVLAKRLVTSSRAEIEAFLKEALAAGHEGLMAKQLDSPYTVGKRGKRWFKIKPADTLDVAILAAEWGHGRRTGTLSNYWLGVRDGDRWQMIGKTFKGLTDRERRDLMDRP